ncbi:hypothetical protein PsorP6_016722 [Peronosclerospora sorghi]|uniref:Uncharacterized protein n=1 Tax=Peronosclerospora sorghi TaxID=230839 RepID=A0ACC0WD01_9STRA|nr:hypothetical protein PsorP6_016722 [Peronosclerospora sorghi]
MEWPKSPPRSKDKVYDSFPMSVTLERSGVINTKLEWSSAICFRGYMASPRIIDSIQKLKATFTAESNASILSEGTSTWNHTQVATNTMTVPY